MNGAEALLRTLAGAGTDVCFANPGTSELHVVSALDRVPEVRGVLTLFEGVATGAADGFGRVAGRPASTLLHLGPGLANGLANLHNARRARTPVVVVVGDHATSHQRLDAPLQTDLTGLARTVSGWHRVAQRAEDVGGDAADAVDASYGPPGCVATLVMPADVSWSEGARPGTVRGPTPAPQAAAEVVEAAARALSTGGPAALLLGGAALSERGLRAAARVARRAGVALYAETFPAAQARGGGLVEPERLAYLPDMARAQLSGLRRLVLAGATAPVSFFAYPGQPGELVPDGCEVQMLAASGHDVPAALEALGDTLGEGADRDAGAGRGGGAGRRGGGGGGGGRRGGGGGGGGGGKMVEAGDRAGRPGRPSGALTAETLAAAVGHLLPEGAVVVDEAVTGGFHVPSATAHGPRHDWLSLTGGAIGQGLPVATGAAVAAPDRKVVALEGDGSALYTIQSLWTQARESLDVTTVVLSNRSYAILAFELARMGADPRAPRSAPLTDLDRPPLDFVRLAEGLGVPASRARTAEELSDQLARGLAADGPVLVEAVLAPG